MIKAFIVWDAYCVGLASLEIGVCKPSLRMAPCVLDYTFIKEG